MIALYVIGSALLGGALLLLIIGDDRSTRIAAAPMILLGVLVWSFGVDIEASDSGKRIGAADGYRDGVYACYEGTAVLDTLSNGNVVITEIRRGNDP